MTHRRASLIAGCLAAGLFAANGAAWSADNLVFVPLPPCRVIDTRVSGAGGRLVAGTPRTFIFRGPTLNYQNPTPLPNQGGSTTGCGVPDLTNDGNAAPENIAKAVAINIVAVAPDGAGDLRAWPANQTMPTASVINYAALTGLNLANGVIVPMCDEAGATPCAGGDITFRADVSGAYLVVDVVGYFHAGSTQFTLSNTALGHHALQAVTATGIFNTASGAYVLASNTTGRFNTAAGAYALSTNTTGLGNTAAGMHALQSNTTGNNNIAIGDNALPNNTTGSYNIAVGFTAGLSIVTGNSNIDIGSQAAGDESHTIRIGSQGTSTTEQNQTFIAGIYGSTSSSGTGVFVNSNGQLGTLVSSRRFKEDIADMGEASAGLMELRPVTFHYRPEHDDGSRLLQYGLIAEEVAAVLPGLVQYDRDGQPRAVRYHFVNAMLLNEVQKLHREAERQKAELADQRRAIADLEQERDAETAALRAQLSRVLERLASLERRAPEMARPQPTGTRAPAVRRR